MQPSASAIDGVKLIKGEVGVESMVNEAAFLKKRVQDVPVDQVLCLSPCVICNANQFCFKRFFHQYFTRKDEKGKAKAVKGGKRKGDEDEDDEEVDGAGKASSDDAVDEVAKMDDEDDSDAEEAEIWEVNLFPKVFLRGVLAF